MDTPERIALLRQSQVLIRKISDLTGQLEAVTKAMFPPAVKRQKMQSPKEMLAELDRRIRERDRVRK